MGGTPRRRGPEYYLNWERIPNLNYDSLAVRSWMLDVVDEWAPLVDGFRADVAWGVPHGFWKEVADRVPAEFLLLNETIPHDPAFAEGEFGAHYETELYGTRRSVGDGEAPADAVLETLETVRRRGFPGSSVHLRYVKNHDEDRYLEEYGEGALRAAAATFTLPGAPMVYYGQERGATDYRGPMPWHDGDAALTAYHRSLSRCRAARPALRSGGVERLDRTVIAGSFLGNYWPVAKELFVAEPAPLPGTYTDFRHAVFQATLRIQDGSDFRARVEGRSTTDDDPIELEGRVTDVRQGLVVPANNDFPVEHSLVLETDDGTYTIGGKGAFVENVEADAVTLLEA